MKLLKCGQWIGPSHSPPHMVEQASGQHLLAWEVQPEGLQEE